MTQTSSRHPELDAFVQELLEFTRACGSPRYRELVRLAPQVLSQYGERPRVLRDLSLTTVSDILNRRRHGPPPWGWVATYVLTCLHFVDQAGGVKPDFHGPTDLQGWYVRYHTMRTRMDRQADGTIGSGPAGPWPVKAEPVEAEPVEAEPVAFEAPVSARQLTGEPALSVRGPAVRPPLLPGAGLPWAGPPAEPAPFPLEPGPCPDMSDDALAVWMDGLPTAKSMAHRRYHELFGQHGVDLLTAAEVGDSDAACRLGILLTCVECPAEASAWLVSAARAGDEAAEVLMAACPSERRQLAAELAYELTLPGYDQDRPASTDPAARTGAESYYRAAAQAGHSGSIVRLGLMYEARGELLPALSRFRRAVELRHPDAALHLDRVLRLLEADNSQAT